MRILFIIPSVGMEPFFPGSVAQASAVLKQEGHARRAVILNDRAGFDPSPQAALQAAREFQPELVALVVPTSQARLAREIARDLKALTKAPIVCAGPRAQADPAGVAAEGVWDFIAVGDGEQAAVELCRRLKDGKPADDIPGLWAVTAGGVRENPSGPPENLAGLPRKDYEIFPYQQIVDALDGQAPIATRRGALFRYGDRVNRPAAVEPRDDVDPPLPADRTVPRRPVEEVIADVAFLLDAYRNIRLFVIEDDAFTDDKEYVIRFSEAYRAVSKLPFVVNAALKGFDMETARCLKWAGCRLARFHIRSGSDGIRKMVLKRTVPMADILKALATCRKEGLPTSVLVTLGYPGEKREDLVETIRFLGLAQADRMRWDAYFPLPGTELAESAVRSGAVPKDLEVPSDLGAAPVLDFGAEQNLFLDKVFALLPWYVNACSEMPCAPLYDALIRWVDDLPSETWKAVKPKAHTCEESLAAMLNEGQLLHYGFRPASRTAFRSDAL